ncbi:hypothetical protein D3C78_1623530 [compost metagenome]
MIGIDQMHALIDKILGDRAFTAADTAREAKNPGFHLRVRLSLAMNRATIVEQQPAPWRIGRRF